MVRLVATLFVTVWLDIDPLVELFPLKEMVRVIKTTLYVPVVADGDPVITASVAGVLAAVKVTV